MARRSLAALTTAREISVGAMVRLPTNGPSRVICRCLGWNASKCSADRGCLGSVQFGTLLKISPDMCAAHSPVMLAQRSTHVCELGPELRDRKILNHSRLNARYSVANSENHAAVL